MARPDLQNPLSSEAFGDSCENLVPIGSGKLFRGYGDAVLLGSIADAEIDAKDS